MRSTRLPLLRQAYRATPEAAACLGLRSRSLVDCEHVYTGWDSQGVINTMALKAKANIVPVERGNERAPDYRVFVGTAESGAAWSATAKNGNAYLSVKLDDPSFAAPIFARLVESDGSFALVWSR